MNKENTIPVEIDLKQMISSRSLFDYIQASDRRSIGAPEASNKLFYKAHSQAKAHNQELLELLYEGRAAPESNVGMLSTANRGKLGEDVL